MAAGHQVLVQMSSYCCGFQILVHGEQNEMARLKAALIREYEDNDEVHIEVHNPRNTEAVTLNFRGEKLAKVRPQLSFTRLRFFLSFFQISYKKNYKITT